MKIYIEYENQIEASSNLVKVTPRTKDNNIIAVNISARCKPIIKIGKPYEYESEINEMLKHISNQNLEYEKLKKEYENVTNRD